MTLLPGSRALTAENFALQVERCAPCRPNCARTSFLPWPTASMSMILAKKTGLRRTSMLSAEPDDMGGLSDGDLTIHMGRGGAMGNMLAASDLVLSQAGTATVQALGLGKPAITFVNPRDRRSRFCR